MVVFQPYKHYHAEAIDNASRTGCFEFDKIEFLTSIDWIRRLTFKPTKIHSAFKATGLIPFYPCIVINKLSNVVNTSVELGTQPFKTSSPPFEIHSPSTPPQLPELNLTIPQTICSLKKHAQLLHYQLDQLPQHADQSLQKYLNRSLALAPSGAPPYSTSKIQKLLNLPVQPVRPGSKTLQAHNFLATLGHQGPGMPVAF